MSYPRPGNPGSIAIKRDNGTCSFEKVTLSPSMPQIRFVWDARQQGEAVFQVTACAPNADWEIAGREAAIIEVAIDGQRPFDIVLFMGVTSFTYTVCMGPVEAKPHEITIRLAADKAAPAAGEVVISSFEPYVVEAAHPYFTVLAHTPMLFGRDVNHHSDVPLLMWYQEHPLAGGKRRLVYTAMWSNEDGGTSTLGLITTWGHTTDIEWIYDLTLGASGEIESEHIQAPGHERLPFNGQRLGKHPILVVSTTNNNVVDAGVSPYFIGLYPAEHLPPGATREEMMDRYPWSHRVTAAELAREGKMRPALLPLQSDKEKLLNQRQIADLRNYVYIDFQASVIDGCIGFAVQRKNDPMWYGWYPEYRIAGIGRSGVNRLAVEVPAGTTWSDIEAVRVHTRAASEGKSYEVILRSIQKVMMLQADYTPGPAILTWNGPQQLGPDHETLTIPVRV